MSPVTQNPQTMTAIASPNPKYSIASTAPVPATSARVVTIYESSRLLKLSTSVAAALRRANDRQQKRDNQDNKSELQRQSPRKKYFHRHPSNSPRPTRLSRVPARAASSSDRDVHKDA